MPVSATFTLGRLCAGGGHADVRVVIDTDPAVVLHDLDTATLRQPLTAIEKRQLAELLVRAKLSGLTPVQARNVMQAGFAVAIS